LVFQFLIGRLQTLFQLILEEEKEEVSIPHR